MADRLAVFFDPDVLEHQTGQGFFDNNPSPYLSLVEKHPENDDRVKNMLAVLENGPIVEALDWCHRGPAERADLERFHAAAYIDELSEIPVDESRHFSGTTVFGPRSFEICCKAAGLAIGAAEHVYDNKGSMAYALIRPPGHHAQPAMADGYCFFNNIGIAIEKLRSKGLEKAAVIDWDVHHGNGTQEGFYADPDILTVSMHMDHGAWGGAWGGTHPQTGGTDEAGKGPGLGKNLNLPMPFGSGDNKYLKVLDEIIAPMIREHRPEILFIAAGQDASQFDPNGRQLLSMHGFYELGKRARMLADECCEGKLVLIQEGGYSVSYAAYCLHATLEGVLNREPGLPDPIAFLQDNDAGIDDYISQVREIFDQSCSHS
jgi:acetoin utilization deacetylase AcuC-like enzyme